MPWRAQLEGESRLSKLCQEKTRSSHAGRVHHVHRTKSGLQNSLKYAFEDGELSALRTKNNSHQRRFHFPQASPQRLAGCLTSFTLQSRCRRTLWLSSLPLIMMQWSPIWLRVVLWLRSVAENQVPRKSQKTQIQIWAPATEVAAGRADYAALVGPPLIQFYEDRYGIKWDWLLTIIPKVHINCQLKPQGIPWQRWTWCPKLTNQVLPWRSAVKTNWKIKQPLKLRTGDSWSLIQQPSWLILTATMTTTGKEQKYEMWY